MIEITSSGDFHNLEKFLSKMKSEDILQTLNTLGQKGVSALKGATPSRTGKTAASWGYTVEKTSKGYSIFWVNSNSNDGIPIAILIQYGHGTGTGGFVQGFDYINPALRPVFQEIADEAWRVVTTS